MVEQSKGMEEHRPATPSQELVDTVRNVLRNSHNDPRKQSNSTIFGLPIIPPFSSNISNFVGGTSRDGSLSRIPRANLEEWLQPVLHLLEALDAQALLGLPNAKEGAQIQERSYVQPIYESIQPALKSKAYAKKGNSCVRYLHLAEIPDEFSIGIFVFPPGGCIPLHDHPEMCVLSRILYGDLQRLSLDVIDEQEEEEEEEHSSPSFFFNAGGGHHGSENSSMNNNNQDDPSPSNHTHPKKRSSWLGGLFRGRVKHQTPVPGAFVPPKWGWKNKVDHLQAPDVTSLFPLEGNLHEFVAGAHGAAVLDILLPPYDNHCNRDCTFYQIIESSSFAVNDDGDKAMGRERYRIEPTGQPENFHCISGKFGNLGEPSSDR